MQISALSFRLTPAIRRHVASRLQQSLAGCSEAGTGAASVWLADINGTRGGIDKQCRVSVPVRAATPVVAVATDRDLYAAVDQATAKLRRCLRRQRSRRRMLWRGIGNGPRPAA